MGSDRARNSYDPARRWRKVVAQQGRVTVEADDNEAWTIANEERREETLDVVGPTGTPDDGYRVDPDGSPAGLSVGPGTFYVGGLRHVTEGIVYGDQEEWLDRSDDPDWTEPDGRGVHGNALVWWWGREHEVGATEDPTLREVALGGPDTSQRERVVQRVKLFATEADDCSTALDKLADAWAEQGLWFDPDGMRLRSDATLAVDFTGPATAPDPCEPEAVGGYLGADNQLVRVQVSSWDAATGTGTLLWGVDNASFLYRVDVVDAQTLRLRSRPVDDFHQPQPGQAVEVLRCAARLGADEYVASATGEPFTLTSAYAPDTQRIALPGPVSAATADPNLTPAAFLRVWEEHLPFTPGTAVALGTTGLEVTLKTGGVAFHPGDHWLLAVRPATPTQVYPARFLDGPQPPDGPRLWAAPLAVVQWGDEKGTVLDDCRDPFDNLVDLTRRRGGGCCEVMLRPEDVQSTADLRAAVDKANGGSVCLRPGVYELDEPLRLGPGDEGLELAGCHGDVVFRVAEGSQQAFEHGMVLVFAHRVSIKGIRFAIPAAPAKMLQRAAAKMLGTDSLPGVVAEHLRDLVETVHTAIAVRAVHAHWLRVEACRFDFPETEGERLYGAAVHASGACRWLRIVDNLVVGEGHIGPRPAGAAQRRMLYGLLSVAGAAGNPDDEYGGGGPPLLDEALVGDNRMNGLAAGVLTIARLGRVVIEGNHVTGSHAGFLLLARHRTWPFGFSGAPGPSPHNSEHDIATLIFVVGDPVVLRTVLLSALLPLPTEPEDEPAEEARTASTSATAPDDMRRSTARRLLDRLSGRHGDEVEVEVPVDEVEAVPVDEVEREAKSTARLSLHVADNVVDCRVVDGDSNAALLVIDDRYETYSTTTTDANRFDSSSNVMATTFLLLVDRGAITGNVVRNHGENGWSLAVVVDEDKRGERVAITGNSCDGNVFLPPRPMYPPPFHQWHVLNAITP